MSAKPVFDDSAAQQVVMSVAEKITHATLNLSDTVSDRFDTEPAFRRLLGRLHTRILADYGAEADIENVSTAKAKKLMAADYLGLAIWTRKQTTAPVEAK